MSTLVVDPEDIIRRLRAIQAGEPNVTPVSMEELKAAVEAQRQSANKMLEAKGTSEEGEKKTRKSKPTIIVPNLDPTCAGL